MALKSNRCEQPPPPPPPPPALLGAPPVQQEQEVVSISTAAAKGSACSGSASTLLMDVLMGSCIAAAQAVHVRRPLMLLEGGRMLITRMHKPKMKWGIHCTAAKSALCVCRIHCQLQTLQPRLLPHGGWGRACLLDQYSPQSTCLYCQH